MRATKIAMPKGAGVIVGNKYERLTRSVVIAQGCVKVDGLGVIMALEPEGRERSASGPKGGERKTRITESDEKSNTATLRRRSCPRRAGCCVGLRGEATKEVVATEKRKMEIGNLNQRNSPESK